MSVVFDAFAISIVALFSENIIFARGFGVDEAIELAYHRRRIVPFSLIVTWVMTMSAIEIYLVNTYLLKGQGLYYLQPLVTIGCILVVYVLTLVGYFFICKKGLLKQDRLMFPENAKKIARATFNCAVVGTVLLTNTMHMELRNLIGFALGGGVGFLLASLVIYEGKTQLDKMNLPKAFKGLPALLLYIGILSLALYGLIGYQLPY